MNIRDFHNIIYNLKCPNCGVDYDELYMGNLKDDTFTCTCSKCKSEIQVTYRVTLRKMKY